MHTHMYVHMRMYAHMRMYVHTRYLYTGRRDVYSRLISLHTDTYIVYMHKLDIEYPEDVSEAHLRMFHDMHP
jgi:hypothetical protein